MSGVDERVVQMTFNNGNFEKRLGDTIRSLDNLRQSLDFSNSKRNIDDLSNIGKNFSLGSMSTQVDGVSAKFLALATIGVTALATITERAVSAGISFVKSFSFDPITDGLREFETNMNSIQTILANTSSKGSTLSDVNGALLQLNNYSDKTIYNFSEMARNIGTFTAAGVDLNTSVAAIKGIANLAAISGSSADQAATAMYQLSQAIATGTVRLMDWNSVVNAGMGGEIFQKALFTTGQAMGTLTNVPVGTTFEDWKKSVGGFRNSLSDAGATGSSTGSQLAKATKDSSEQIAAAEESAARAVESAEIRVSDARASSEKVAKDTAKQITEAQKAKADSAIKSASDIAKAEKDESDVFVRTAKNINTAVEEQRKAFEAGAAGIKAALDGVIEAQRRLTEAMKPTSENDLQAATDRLTRSQLDQADSTTLIADAEREQKRAAEDLDAARQALSVTQADSKHTANDLLSAQRRVEDAESRLADLADAVDRARLSQNDATRAVTDAEEQLAKAKEKGTEKDQQVIDAQDALTKAQEAVVTAREDALKREAEANKHMAEVELDALTRRQEAIANTAKVHETAADNEIAAAQRLADVTEQVADRQAAAARSLADAEKSAAQTRSDSQKSVAKAHESAADRISSAGQTAGRASQGWLTGEVLTTTLEAFTGDLTAAELMAKGYTQEQATELIALGKLGLDAATKVKTLTQLLSTIKEALGSGWSQTFQILIGDFQEAENLFTDLSISIGGFIAKSANARNEMLKQWKDFGGRTALIQGFKDALSGIHSILIPIGQAFREIFPKTTAEDLLKMTAGFAEFAKSIKIGADTASNIKDTFAGFFAVLEIGWAVLKGVGGVIVDVVKSLLPVGDGLLTFSAGMGRSLTDLDKSLVTGGKIKDFFEHLGAVITTPITAVEKFTTALIGLFKATSGSSKAEEDLGRVGTRLDEIASIPDKVTASWIRMEERFSGVFAVLGRVWDYIKTWFSELGGKLASAFQPGDFDAAVDIVNVGLLGGIALMLKRFLSGGMKFDFGGGLIQKISLAFTQLTKTLKAMQTELKAQALEKIAIAIAVLTASLVVLSLIDSVALTKALTAMGVAFGEMVGVMILIDKLVASNTAAIKLGIIGAALIEFATAAAILTLAIRNLSGLSWEELTKGLVGVAGGLVLMVLASNFIGENSVQMIAAGLGMTAISVGLLVLSEAVKLFATMSWGEMAKGLVGVAGGLALVTLAMNFMPASSVISGLGFIEIALGLTILAEAVKMFGGMDWGVMGKGLLGMAGALILVVGAMQLMPLSAPITAAGLLILSFALVVMAEAVKILGNMDMGALAKGIGGLAGMMLILALATNAMNGALPGAAALVVVSAALTVLVVVLEKLSGMKTEDIIKSLISLAAVLAILGLAAFLLEPVIPALLGLGAAIALIGGGFALFGAGVWLVAKGLEELARSGVAGVKAFVEFAKTVVTALPEILGAVIKTFIDQSAELLKAAPLLVRLITAVLAQLLDTIIQLSPKLGKALVELFKAALGFLREIYPDYIRTGFEILLGVLQGIRKNIGEIVTVVAEIVINFIDALRKKIPAIVNSVYNLMVTVLTEVAKKIGESTFLFIPVAEAFLQGLLTGFITFLPGIIEFFAGLPGDIVGWIGDVSPTLLEKGVDLITGLISGIENTAVAVSKWFVDLPGNILGWIGDVIPTLTQKGVDLLTGFLNGLVQKVVEITTWFVDLPGNILGWLGDVLPTLFDKGTDIIKGFLDGVIEKGLEVMHWFMDLPKKILDWLGDVVSTMVEKGIDVIQGFLNGLVEKTVEVMNWFKGMPAAVTEALGDVNSWLIEHGRDMISGLLSGISDKWFDVLDFIGSFKNSVLSHIGDALTWLYQKGRDVIEGLWNGIFSIKDWFLDKMKTVADWVTNPVGAAFEIIGAPSRVMCGMGKKVGLGFVNGLLEMATPVREASATLSDQVTQGFDTDTTVEGINKIFNEIVSHLEGMDDFNPTITPVLDLTKVKMGARDLTDLFNQTTISPMASFDQAQLISTTAELSQSAADEASAAGPSEVVFNQYNHSPEALSTNDIYRNTKSQIALAKEELGIS